MHKSLHILVKLANSPCSSPLAYQRGMRMTHNDITYSTETLFKSCKKCIWGYFQEPPKNNFFMSSGTPMHVLYKKGIM